MTVVVPHPVPLELPEEHADALVDLMLDVAGAADSLALVGDGLAGIPEAVPHWAGADADAAVIQLRALRRLTGECSVAVLLAAGRLSEHSDRLAATRTAVARLRAEQDDDFAATWRRLGQLPDYVVAVRTDAPQAQALVDELRTAEEERRRRHAALLEDLALDAAATARMLADAAAVVGGRGAADDEDRVVARLASVLPGWGNAEMAARGRALGSHLRNRPLTTSERQALAAGAADFAGSRAFADSLIAALGSAGLAGLLRFIGGYEEGTTGAVALLLARAFSASSADGSSEEPPGDLLSAARLTRADRNGDVDQLARGIANVMSAAAAIGRPLRPGVLVQWGRQLIACESVLGREVGSVPFSSGAGAPPADPLTLVVTTLAAQRTSAAVLDLFSAPGAWDVALSRFWPDGAVGLQNAIGLVASTPGEAAAEVTRSGLMALGAGLADGDPGDWTVSPRTAETVAPVMAQAVAGHVQVATDALRVGIDGRLAGGRGDVLRGLAYLTLDRVAAAQVERALLDWARVRPEAVDAAGSTARLLAVAVPAAYVAVEQYGQRLAYAMHGFDEKLAAEGRQTLWNCTVGLLVNALPGVSGAVAGVAEGGLSVLLHTDGTWRNGRDRGLVFDRRDAADAAAEAAPGGRESAALDRQAADAFARTLTALGLPVPPISPDQDPELPGLDALSTKRHALVEPRAHWLRDGVRLAGHLIR